MPGENTEAEFYWVCWSRWGPYRLRRLQIRIIHLPRGGQENQEPSFHLFRLCHYPTRRQVLPDCCCLLDLGLKARLKKARLLDKVGREPLNSEKTTERHLIHLNLARTGKGNSIRLLQGNTADIQFLLEILPKESWGRSEKSWSLILSINKI